MNKLIVALVFAFVACVAATPAWDLQYVSTHYDASLGQTLFEYTLNSADADVLHLYLADHSCGVDEHAVSKGAGWTQYQSNHVVNMHGYKYVYGQEKANVQTYILALEGKVGTGPVTAKAYGSGHEVSFSVSGPNCASSVAYPQITATDFPDTQKECLGPIRPDGSAIGRCNDAYSLNTVHDRSTSVSGQTLKTTYTQVEHGDDTTAPVWLNSPWTHKTIECTVKKDGKPTELPPLDALAAQDNCDPAPHVDDCVEEHTSGKCEGNYYKTRTWTATDRCGNARCLTQTITVQDTVDPVILGTPADITYDCDPVREEERLAFTEPTADDDCCITQKPQLSELHIDGKCRNTFTKERTWTVEDCCGNKAVTRQTLVIKDDTPPTLEWIDPEPADVVTVECNEVPLPQHVCAHEECTTAELKFKQIRHDGSCLFKYALERVWTAVDECGNEFSQTKTVNVIDTSKPTFDQAPADITVECGSVPAVPVVTAQDVCGSASITFNEVVGEGTCDNGYTITRTWTATDACGNSRDLVQVVTVQDTTAPVFDADAIPADQNVQCVENVVVHPATLPVFTPATKTCSATSAIVDPAYTGGCKLSGDAGENQAVRMPAWVAHHTFTMDTNAPASLAVTHPNSPTDERVTFRARIFSRANANVAFNITIKMSGRRTVLSTEVNKVFDPYCYYTNREADWRNWASYSNVDEITLTGSGSLSQGAVLQATGVGFPVMGGGANGITPSEGLLVNAHWHVASQPTVGDAIPILATPAIMTVAINLNCAVHITQDSRPCESEVTPKTAVVVNQYTNCPNDLQNVITWEITDCAGNSATVQRTNTVKDTTAPTLSGVPVDTSAACDAVPAMATPTASDNCATFDNTVVPVEKRTDGACQGDYSLLRTWTTTDACGNAHSESQTITVTDTVAPQWGSLPVGEVRECDNLPARPTDISASDACGLATISDLPDTRVNGSCLHQYTLEMNWEVVDDCGNRNTHKASWPIQDTTAPTLSGVPAAASYYCNAVPAPAQVCAEDTCDTVTVEFRQEKGANNPPACAGSYELTRIWTATDACGNTKVESQVVTVYDDKAPVPTAAPPADYSVSCDAIPTTWAPPTANDDCSTFTTTPDHTETAGKCLDEKVLHKKWVLTDACGNSEVWKYDVTVFDTAAPVITGVPADTSVYCTDIPAVPTTPHVEDNCDNTVQLSYNEVKTDGTCTGSYTLTRTWSATDRCGNTASKSQVITVTDGVGPVFNEQAPSDTVSYQCSIPAQETMTGTDACGGAVVVTPNAVDNQQTCPKTVTRTWTATDDCGTNTVLSQVITLDDTTLPTLNGVPAAQTTECTEPSWATVTASDNCAPDWVVAGTTDNVNTIVPFCNVEYTRKWATQDGCGNQVSATQVVTVKDTLGPRFDDPTPTNQERECDNKLPMDTGVTGVDDCDQNPVVSEVHEAVVPGSCPQAFSQVRKWKIVDRCGFEAFRSYTYNEVDTTSPFASSWDISKADRTVDTANSCAVPPVPVPTLQDNCDSAPTVQYSAPDATTNCKYTHVVTRRWDYTDACGNTAFDTQVVTFTHSTNPTLAGVPVDSTATCTHPAAPTVTSTDACGESLTVNLDETKPVDKCAHDYTLKRVWSATDSCGLPVSAQQLIVVSDNTMPVFSATPASRTGRNMASNKAAGNEVCSPDAPAVLTATDNCAGIVPVTMDDLSPAAVCPNEFTKVYKWSTVDVCSNPNTYTQTITYKNTYAPVFTSVLPAAGATSHTCESVPVQPKTDAKDACDAPLDAVEKRTRTDGTCTDSYKLVDEWDAVDACGLTVHHERTLNIFDTTPPTLSAGPSSVTVECGFVPDAPTLTASDNCDEDVNVQMVETKIPGSNCCDYQLKRVWTATDNCGNTDVHEQIITVHDTIAPVLVGVPQDITVPCDQVPVMPTDITSSEAPIAEAFCAKVEADLDTANCFPSVTLAARKTALSLNGKTYEWVAANPPAQQSSILVWQANGNTFVWGTVFDTAAPTNKLQVNLTLSGTPTSATGVVEADTTCVPSMIDATTWKYYSTVVGSIVGTGVNVVIETSSVGPAQVGVGASNLNGLFGASVFVRDAATQAEGVLRMSLINQAQGCDVSTFHDMPNLSCGPVLTVTPNEVKTQGTCTDEYTLVRTWSATDPSGNLVTSSQTITVYDNQAPTWDSEPLDEVIECGPVPVQQPLTAVDLCDQDLTYVKGESTDNSPAGAPSCPQNFNVNRWWTAVDNCGNGIRHEQQLRVRDTTDPSVLNMPADVTVQCHQVPLAADAGVTGDDACDKTVQPVYSVVPTAGRCSDERVEVRTWTVTDACGNDASDSQTVTVIDTTAPVLGAIPADLTLECHDVLPEPKVSWTDNCAAGGDVLPTKTTTTNNCGLPTHVQTWSVVDNCGNSDSGSRTVTYLDTQPPSLSSKPVDVTVACDQVPSVPVITGSDACDGALTPVFTEERRNGGAKTCSNYYFLYRTWTVTDCAGNVDTHTQQITVQDTEAPVLGATPADETVHCTAVPAPVEVCATDNCDGMTTAFKQDRTDGTCRSRYSLLRTWTATDACGNTDVKTQTITVDDQVKPTFTNLPADLSEECQVNSSPIQPGATDDCSEPFVVLEASGRTPGSCANAYTNWWRYKAEDQCGNSDVHTTSYTVTDDSAPVIVAPADQNVKCHEAKVFASASSSDNCDATHELTFNDQRIDGSCSDTYTMRRTWTAVDACGNTASASADIHVVDDANPMFVGVSDDRHNECQLLPIAKPGATDACDAAVDVSDPKVVMVANSCPYEQKQEYTWTATDNCGNFVTVSRFTSSHDSQVPTLSGLPADQTVSCDSIPAVPALSSIIGHDDCDPAPIVTYEGEKRTDGTCDHSYMLTRTWKVTDACGKSSTASYTLTVEDNQKPTMDQEYSDSTHECSALPAAPIAPKATDNCDPAPVEVTIDDATRVDGSCSFTYDLKYHWTATDNCGNANFRKVTRHIVDTTKPEFGSDAPIDNTYECQTVPAAVWPSISDNCGNDAFSQRAANSGSFQYASTEQVNTPANDQCQNYEFDRTWTIADACGNSQVHSQHITVRDRTAPQFVQPLPVDITLNCEDDVPMPVVTATDNCGAAAVTMVETVTQTPGKCAHWRTIRRDYTATDQCGNTTPYTYFITIKDDTAPTLDGVPADVSAECDNVPAPAHVCAHDFCAEVELTFQQVKNPSHVCASRFTLERTWSADDLCGNTITETQVVSIDDTQAPEWTTAIPSNYTIECTTPPSMPPMEAKDNCQVPTVSRVPEKIPGGCAANYTQLYKFRAEDDCGNFIQYTQNVTVHDTVPPTASAEPICIFPVVNVDYAPKTRYHNVTVPGEFFEAADACSAVTIKLLSCVSNQDMDVGAAVVDGFSEDCIYDAQLDTILLNMRFNWTDLSGRVFTLQAEVTDACGHVTPVEKLIWIPANDLSGLHYGQKVGDMNNPLTALDFVAKCGPPHSECTEGCECQYNEEECAPKPDSFSVGTPTIAYDDLLDQTTFVYPFSGPTENRPSSLLLSLDLSSSNGRTPSQLVKASPDTFQLGAQPGSFLSGINWVIGTANSFSFTLAGKYTGGGKMFSTMMSEDNVCSPVVDLVGPSLAVQHVHTGVIGGYVHLAGVREGVSRNALTAVKAVVVHLIDANDQVVRFAMTNEDGFYQFAGVDSAAYRVAVASDGLLRQGVERSSGNHILQTATSGVYRYGAPVAAHLGLDNNLDLLFDNQRAPVYDRNRHDRGSREDLSFNGNGKSVGFWAFQYKQVNPLITTKTFNYPANSLQWFETDAKALLGGCPDPKTMLSATSTALRQRLAAVAFNHVAGLGVMEPYRNVQLWTISYARHIACDAGAGNPTDNAMAMELLHRMIEAW